MYRIARIACLAPLLCALLVGCRPAAHQQGAQTSAQAAPLQSAFARLAEVSQLSFKKQPDGGTLVSGNLSGAPFVARFPAHWNRQSLVFAHGYTLVSAQADTVPADPVQQDPSSGILPAAYAQGFVVAQSAYDKRGFALESGIERTAALSRMLGAVGAKRAYIAGFSQGGSVTELALERYPQQFSGAIAACGVVGGWEKEINYITHLRTLYNYFAAGTRYQLPGQQDVTKDAGVSPSALALTLLRLYAAAALSPRGQAAGLIERVASAVPGVETHSDIGTLGMALLTQTTGIEDFTAQAGGVFMDNTATIYYSPLLSESGNQALNKAVQRYSASPQALARARQRWTPTGQFAARLLTLHNAYDPLVPVEHERWLLAQVQQAHNEAHLRQDIVPTTYSRLPKVVGFKAASHCGFSPQQGAQTWQTLRQWVEGEPPERSLAGHAQ